MVMKDVPTWLNIIYSVILGLLSVFTVVQVIKLAIRKGSARIIFLWIIPLLWLFTGIEKYYAYITIYSEVPSKLYVIISNTLYALIWGCMFIFYKSRKTKDFFSVDS
jgi:hypothetical protein